MLPTEKQKEFLRIKNVIVPPTRYAAERTIEFIKNGNHPLLTSSQEERVEFIIKNQKAFAQTGGGIVADSDPNAEWNETITKARALLAGIKAVQNCK